MSRGAAFIQAGGVSSRMGTDKAFLKLGDKCCIEHVMASARRVTDHVAIVANEPSRYQDLGLILYPDLRPGFGPLSGLHTALAHCRTEWAIVLACDLPFVTAELLGFMLERAEDVDAVVPMDQNGILQPLCALYSTRCLLPTVELINSGVSAPRRLCGKVTTRVLAFAEIAHLDYAQWFFLDIDSPLDYQQALTLVQNKSRIRT